MVEGELKNIEELECDERAAVPEITTDALLFNILSKYFKIPKGLDWSSFLFVPETLIEGPSSSLGS